MPQLLHLAPESVMRQAPEMFFQRSMMVILSQLLAGSDWFVTQVVQNRLSPNVDGSRKIVLADVPVFEGETLSDKEYFEALQLCNANEIIIPDVRFDASSTIQQAEKYFPLLQKQFPDATLVGVPQGKTAEEYLFCAKELLERFPLTKLAIVEEAETLWEEVKRFEIGRTGVISRLRHFLPTTFKDRNVKVHFLGLSEHPQELFWVEHLFPGCVTTCDTAKVVVWSKHEKFLPVLPISAGLPTYPGRGEDYFNQTFELTPLQLVILKGNDDTCKSWGSGMIEVAE